MTSLRSPAFRFAAALALPLACAGSATAQIDHDSGEWYAFMGQGKLDFVAPELSRVRWWLDVHVRQRDEGENFATSIVRPGLGYALNDAVTAWVGHAWVVTDMPRGEPFSEHRTWQQVSWDLDVGSFAPALADLNLSSRTRLEERFVEDHGTIGWRLRQQFKATYPLISSRRLFTSVWDELFWDLNDAFWGSHGQQRSGFSQNRLFAGIGYQLDAERRWSLEVGYLNQLVNQHDDDNRMNHALALWLFASF